MTTLTAPALSHRAMTESFLAAAVAAIAILVMLIWIMTGITGAVGDQGRETRVPSPQAQVAPQPGR